MITQHIPAPIQGISQQAPELRLPTTVDAQINCVNHPVYGLGRRTGTDHIRVIPGVTSADNIWASWVGRDAFERYAFIFDGRAVRVFGLDGKELPVLSDVGTLNYLSTTDPKRDLEVLSLNDTYAILNRTKVVQMGSQRSPGTSKIAIVWVRQGNYGQTYRVNINGIEASHLTPDGSTATDVNEIQTSKIAEDLAAACTTAFVATHAVIHTSGDSHFIIISNPPGDEIVDFFVRDSVGNTALGGVYHQAASFAELPPVAPDGYLCRVLGNTGDSSDDYWVRYDESREDGDAGARRGKWVETLAPNTVTSIDPTTLIHAVDRLQDDEAGMVTGVPYSIYFRLKQIEWAPRVCGSEATSPDPSFIGNKINTMFTVQGRLGFAFNDKVVLSRSGDVFNFFRSTVTQVLDNDPIDYEINETKRADDPVINLRHANGFAEQLILNSDRAQIVIPLDQPVTPRNFLPSLVSSFECDPNCKPISVGSSILVPYSDGALGGLREIFTNGPNSAKQDRILTEAVPRLLRGRPWQLSACPAEETVFARTTEQPGLLYVYRYKDINNGRALSAWGVWSFGGADILAFGVIESTLYLILDRPEGPTLESLEIPPYVQTEETARPLLMDRKTPIGPARLRGRITQDTAVAPAGSGGNNSPPVSGGVDPGTDPGTEPGSSSGPGSGSGTISPGGDWPTDDEGSGELPNPTGNGTGSVVVSGDIPDVEPDPSTIDIKILIQTPPLVQVPSLASYTLDAREKGVVSYDKYTNVSTVVLPWDPVPDATVFVRGDNLEELRWARTGPRTVAIEGDITTIPVYAGNVFEHYAILSQPTVFRQSPTGGLVAVRGARLQITSYGVTLSESGSIWLEALRANRGSRLKKFTPRAVGLQPINLSRGGDYKISVLGKAEDIRVKFASISHWPCWVVGAFWTGEVTSDSQLI